MGEKKLVKISGVDFKKIILYMFSIENVLLFMGNLQKR